MEISSTNPITLDHLRALIEGEPPVGAEVASACQYDALELARLCECSLRQLQRVFVEAGRTPNHWLLEHRMLRALAMLEHLDASGELKSIKWLALELGFRHPRHFNRKFKGIFGVTPKEFLVEREKALRSLGVNPKNCRTNRMLAC